MVFVIVMAVITIYALFGDDMRQLVTDKDGDDFFYTLTFIALVAFVIEIILASIAKPNYFRSFFFMLDVVSTVSLIFDIGWFMEIFFPTSDGGSGEQAASAG